MTTTQAMQVSPAAPPGPTWGSGLSGTPTVLEVLEDWHGRTHGAGRMEHCKQEPCIDLRHAELDGEAPDPMDDF